MDDSDGIVFHVGQPWPWDPNLVADRGFGWHPDPGNMLLLVERGVTDQMCRDLAGPVEIALLAHGPLVGLPVRFSGGWGWTETMGWRQPGDGIPEFLRTANPTDHLFFKVVLVDADTKQIAHMRAFTVSPHFVIIRPPRAASRSGEADEVSTTVSEAPRRCRIVPVATDSVAA